MLTPGVLRGWLVVACLLLGTSALQAATYYVSVGGYGDTPNNSNSCTTAQTITTPKRNIQGATGGLPCLAAGDTLMIRGGTYAENIDSRAQALANGTSYANAVTIRNYQSETVWITGSIAMFGVTRQYIILDGINVDGTGYTVLDNSLAFVGDGAHHIRFANGIYKNGPHVGLQCAFGGGANLPHDLHFTNLEVMGMGSVNVNPAYGPGWQHGFYLSCPDTLVEYSHIHDNSGNGGKFFETGTTTQPARGILRYNNLHDNCLGQPVTNAGWYLSGNDNQAYGNIFANHRHTAIGVTGNPSNVQVWNNIIYGTTHYAITVTDGTDGTQIYNNTIANNSHYGIFLGDNSGVVTGTLVKNNILWNNGNGTTDNFFLNGGLVSGTIGASNLCNTASPAGLCTHTGNPNVVNEAGRNYHLQASSTAVINQGVTLALVPDDFDLIVRPQGAAYDIGAYEFGAALAPPTNLRVLR